MPVSPLNGAVCPPGKPVRNRPGQKRYIRQAHELLELIARDAKSATDAKTRAIAVKVWCELHETKRKLSMKPLPGSLRPDRPTHKSRKAPVLPEAAPIVAQPVEPIAPAPDEPAK